MILIAPDKFKGTLTARQAAQIITKAMHPHFCFMAPMADGGEGTAQIIGSQSPWQPRNGYYVNPLTRTAVIDSSSVIGLEPNNDVIRRTSAPLGIKVREILKGGCDCVIIGIGGTGTCDGGVGFLTALDKYRTYANKIIGLSDVEVPLLPASGNPNAHEPSALMFAPQKGATESDIDLLYQRLERAYDDYGHGHKSPFDGAGGGLGFAIATAIGAPCYKGAEYVLENYNIDWNNIDMVITGEGCVDEQTSHGKVVDVVCRKARAHGIPCAVIGGCVKKPYPLASITIDTSKYLPDHALDSEIAGLRLAEAAKSLLQLIR